MEHFNPATMAGYMASPMGSPVPMDPGASEYLDGAFPPIPGIPDNMGIFDTGDFSRWVDGGRTYFGDNVLI